ncbi:retention module-containing protein [Aliivibrio wodanis]|uniref:retention module-containing protein n=1 Tax=Aliivibrio wodanis TaxID=80852 RepID=UPI00406C7C98
MKETVIPSQVEIKTIEGDAYSLNKSGTPTKVNVGQNLAQDSVLFTAYDAKVVVQIHGKLVTIDKNCISCLDETKENDPLQIQQIDDAIKLDPTQSTDGLDIAAIQAAILAGEDPTEILEATAAGEGSGSANNGFVVIDYGYYSSIATTNFTTSNAFSYDNQEYIDNLSGGDASNPPATPIITPNNSGITKEDEVFESSGQLAVTNPQSNLSYTWSITGSPTSEFGTLSLNPTTGQWEYTLNNSALSVQSLANGQLITDVFEVSVSAGGNLTSTQQVTVTIVGTNDDPIISGIAVGELTEGDVDDTDPTVSETLTVADVDTLDTHTWTIVEGGNGKYGVLTINDGVWEYALDNSRDDTQALGKDDVVTETFTIQVDDGNGGIAQQEVVITINGTNDEPVISGTSTGRVVEDLIDSADGQLTAIDADEGDSVSWSVTAPNLGAYGTLTIDSTGKWTYSIDNNLSATQSLSLGETQTETFEVVADDGNGGQVTHTITIDVTGTNDNPEITDTSVISGAVEHRVVESATGDLVFEDVDTLDSHSWTVQPNSNSGLGSFTVDASGKWTFDLNSASTAVIGLGVGETLDIVYRVEVSDNHGATDFQDVTITITGSNDGPVISGSDTGSVVEDVLASVSGELTATDADENDSVSWSITDGAGTFGSLTVDSAGKWTYTLDDSLEVTQAISKDEIKTETFEIIADDGNGGLVPHTITVEVTGTNDIPEITDSSVVTGDVAEVSISAIGDLVLEDIDGLDSHLWTVEPNDNSELGAFTVDSNGRWNFDLNTNAAVFLALGAGETLDVIYVVQVDDQNGGLDTKEVTITVTGSNNGPIIGGTSTGSVVEDTVATASGELVSADLDTTDTATWSVQDPSSGAYGEITVDANGKWTYTIDNTLSATQSLSQGQTETETFTVIVTDGSGAQAAQVVTIDVTGTNDLPEITDTSVIAGSVEHRATESATGELDLEDVDTLDTHSWTIDANTNDDLGTFAVDANGKWTFDLNTASASVIALGVGETLDIVYVVQVEDNHGGIDSQEVTITVTGSNDGPTISGTDTGSVVEDSVAVAEGQLEATDADTTDTHTWSVTDDAGTYGSLAVDTTGKWTYTLNDGLDVTQAISNGEIKTETFEIVANDGKGGTVTHTVTVEVTGTNDLPEITDTSVIAGVVEHRATESVAGELALEDVDTLDTHSWTIDANTNDDLGTFAVDANGKWTFDLNTASVSVIALGVGETLDIVYVVQVEDNHGGIDSQEVTITVTGSNDGPTISGTDTGSVVEDSVAVAEGQLEATDADTTDTHTWSVTDGAGSFGTLTVDGTGKWTYTLDNTKADTQAISQGEVKTETFEVVVNDGNGGTETHTITLEVTGTNDLPSIAGSSVISGNVTEETTLSASGNLFADDVDTLDSHTWTLLTSNTDPFGSITVSTNPDGSGKWEYTLNNTAAQVQALAKGETHTVEYQIQVDDGQGGLTTETISIEIIGTNDAPIVSGQSTGLVKEDTATQSEAEGQLTVDDVDLIDVHAWSVDSNSGTYGSITIDPVTGEWVYTIDNTLSATQELTEGQSVEDKFTVTVDDNQGGTDTIEIVITVVGTNGVPVIGGDIVGDVTEDIALTITGTLTATDEDATSSFNWDIVGSDTGTYGKFTLDATTGVWLYTLDNDAAQSLGAGDDPIKEYYTVELSDGAGGVITETIEITINGTNDLPELSGQATGSVKEDSIETTAGQLIVADVDLSDTHTWDVQPASGTYGSITVDANGKWVYTINNGLDATQHLAEGEPAEDSFIVTVNDGQGGTAQKEIVISLEGTNDLPSIVDSNDTGTVIEDGVQTISDTLIVEDVDDLDTHNWFIVGASESKLGSFSIDAVTGKWTYVLKNDEAQLLAKDETVVEKFVVVVGDGNNGYAQHTVEVTIVGTNDVPTITGRTTGTAVEDIIPTATGALTAVDVDFTDNHTWLVDGGGVGKYGTMSVDADGNWTYALNPDDPDTQALAENQQEFETFTIAVDDGNGGTNAIMITVEVLGTNDAPIIGGRTTRTITEDDAASVSGKLKDGDVDFTDSHTWTLLTDAQGDYGSLSLNANGKWTYTIDNTLASTQGLLAGQKETEQYIIQVEDQYGAIDTVTVTVTVKGTNDIPELSGELTGKIEEDSAITEIEGQLAPDDADIGDSHSWSLSSETGSYGTLSIDASGKWIYTLSNNKDSVQQLSEGEEVTDIFTVTVKDGSGASTQKDIIITIVGDNDDPSITGATTGSTIEGTAGKDVATGDLTAVDIDHLDTHSWSVMTPEGIYGALSIDAATGKWTYQLDNSKPATIGIASGQIVQDKFVVEVDDGEGGTNQIEVIIDIAGTNSSPGIIGDTTGEIKEDAANNEITGELKSGDLDATDVLTWEIIGAAGEYGQFTIDQDGKWTYALNNSNGSVNGLKEGAELVDSIMVKVTDSFGEVSEVEVKITIEGTNDAPVLSGALTGTAIEDQITVIEGQLQTSDPDIDDAHVWNIDIDNGVGKYGSLTMNSSGKWTYSLTNSLLAIQALGPNDTLTETFKVTVTDSQNVTSTDDVVITIQGTNDLPEITGGTTGEYIEDLSPETVTGQLVATDVDSGDSASFEVRTYVGNYGTFYLEADGSWRYEIDKTSAAIQSLGEGDTISETFTAVAHDTNGGFVTEQIDFTIVGTNDKPVVSGDSSATVIEDAQEFVTGTFDNQFTKVTGNVIADDIDLNGEVVSWQVVDGNGIYGTLSIDENGQWTYLLANGDKDTDALDFGDEGIDTFWVTAKDDKNGVSEPFEVTITVKGNTDSGGGGGGSYDEEIDIIAEEEGVDDDGHSIGGDGSGKIVLDPDCAITSVSGTSPVDGGLFGDLIVNPDGSWYYDVDDSQPYVDSLCEGETITEKWTVTVIDDCGKTSKVLINVTIVGTNDAPRIITDSPLLGELGEVIEDESIEVSGQLEVSDPDTCDTHTWYLVDNNGDKITDEDGDATNGTITVQGTYGLLILNELTGAWTYQLDNDNPLVQALTPDQIERDFFNVVVEDDKGAKSTDAPITIKITGVADDVETVLIVEKIDFVEDGSPLSQTGTLDDVDGLTPDLTWNLVSGSGTYGNLTLDNDGNWTYVLDNNSSAVQQLNQDESVSDTFSVTVVDKFGKTVVDEHGEPVMMIFKVDVTGTNDAPDISGTLSGSILNTDDDGKISGNLNDGDVDSSDSHTWSIDDTDGVYGELSINNSGKWTYTLDKTIPEVIALGEGDTLTETFEITVKDSYDKTSTKTITIVIDGSNLPPEFNTDPNAPEFTIELKEDELITDSRTLIVNDPNSGDTVTFDAKTLTGTYGTFTVDANGVWTYTLDNDASHIQGLNEGELVSEVFTVFAVDDHGAKTSQQVTVNITGTNDAPTITGKNTGVVTEEPGSKISGTAVVADVDIGDTSTLSVGSQGQFGTLTVDTAAGKWTYVVNGNHPDVDSLSKGEILTDTAYVLATDSKGGTAMMEVTITINGQNDTPDLVVTVPPELTEDSGVTGVNTIEATGNWDNGDPDASDTHSWQVLSGDALGTLTFDPNGDYKLVVDNTALEIQQLGVDESLELTYSVKVTDEHGLSSTQDITFTVNGTNDDPEVVNTSILSVDVEEDGIGTQTKSGQLDITDIDISDTTFAFDVITSPTDAYGAVTVDANGKWTYVLDNDKAQDIGDETITETFTIQIDDGNGGVITQDVTVNITGTDDDPIIDTTIPQVTEGTVVEDGTLTTTGQVSYVDPEGDLINYNVINPPTSPYGTFTVDANGVWTYELNNTLAQEIGATGTQETYTIEVKDQTGGTIQQVITINITGENDDPTIDVSSVIIGSVDEDGTATAIGQLDVLDVDLTDISFTYSVISGPNTASTPGDFTGLYGSLTVDDNGKWTYQLDSDKAQVLGDTVATEKFTIEVSDGNGGTVTQEITVSVTGHDDQPIVNAGATQETTGTVVEEGELHAEGTITYLDPEGTNIGYTVSTSSTPIYGTFIVNATTGKWEYDLDNTLAQAIGIDGAQESLVIDVTDTTGQVTQQVITIDITGENDSPVITGISTADVKEGVVETVTGQLTATDAESDPITWQLASTSSATGAYGTLSINSAGLWTYILLEDSTLALAADTTDEFTVEASDGKGGVTQQVITVAVAAPTIIQGLSGSDILTGTTNDELLFGNPLDLSDVGTADTFTWTNASIGGDFARDVIKDFDLNSDKIDLSDIANITTVWDSATLASQIQITEVDGSTEIYINEAGATVQTIIVDGITLDELAGESTASMTDEEKFNALTNSGHLVVSDGSSDQAGLLFATGQNDILTGGGGNDIFYFADEIAGSSVSPAQTSIADFAVDGVAANNEADILNLAELLPDSIQASSTIDDMLQHINVNIDDGNSQTVLSVTDDLGNQTDITLQGVDSTTLGISDLGSMSDQDILSAIYNDFNMFKVD